MEQFEQYSLINQKKWTELLRSLDVGEHTFVFPSIPDIKSLKTIGYIINSDKVGRVYGFNVNKGEKKVRITVKAL